MNVEETKQTTPAEDAGVRKNPINRYDCPKCGGFIVTIDRNAGATPAFLRCRASKDCHGDMVSSWYRVPQNLVPAYEWRRPTKGEYLRMHPAMREHVDRGGLEIYPISQRACRVCGCTEFDCRQCVEKTGAPCHWVAPDLCSVCKPKREQKPKRKFTHTAKRRRNRDRANAAELLRATTDGNRRQGLSGARNEASEAFVQ